MKAPGPKPASQDRKLRATAQLLDHTMRMIYSQCFVEGLNPAQWSALRFLAHANASSHTLTCFARVHCVSKAAASDTIAALTRKKLVVKRKDPLDGRVTRIDLTGKGQKLLDSDPLNLLIGALAKLLPEHQDVAVEVAAITARTVFTTIASGSPTRTSPKDSSRDRRHGSNSAR
jgi:DNA-binding MarR family transcriptional regulator